MTVDQALLLIYAQTALQGVISALAFYRFNTRPLYVKLVGVSFLLGLLANVTSILSFNMGFYKYVNLPPIIYGILNFIVISLVYYQVFKQAYKLWFLFINAVCLSFFLYNLFFFQKSELNSYTDALCSFFIIGYSIFYFYRLMVELPSVHLQRIPMFWINSAFLLYCAGTLLLFFFRSYMVHVIKDNLLAFWSFHNLLAIIEHIIVGVGLFIDLSNTKKDVMQADTGRR